MVLDDDDFDVDPDLEGDDWPDDEGESDDWPDDEDAPPSEDEDDADEDDADEDDTPIDDDDDDLLGSSKALTLALDEVSIHSSSFSISSTTVALDDLLFLKPLRDSRKETYAGLLTSIKEMGILNPVWVTPTQGYLEDPEDYAGPKYRLLDGFRRVYSAAKLGLETIPARVMTFNDPDLGAELGVIISLILNKTQKRSWSETWGLIQTLESTSAMSPSTLEWLTNLEPGQSLKLKDVMLCEYPEIIEQFLSRKKTLDQAYSALQKARKEEDLPALDDKRTVTSVEGGEEIADDLEGTTLSDVEVKELLEMSSAPSEALSDDNFGEGSEDMFGEAAENYVQDTKNREAISPELRSKIFRRDDFSCQACGFGTSMTSSLQLGLLEAHHITAVYTGGNDSSENFVTLCNRCHCLVHIITGLNGKIGMTKEEFEKLPVPDQECVRECVKYSKVLLEAEKKSGKSLKKYKPERIPFWVRQADASKIVKALDEEG